VTELDPADLVLIAARTLGIGSDAALAAMDLPAAQAALATADRIGQAAGAEQPSRDAAAAAGAELVAALLRHRPFPHRNQQVAIAAGLQFLSLNGWQADLNPAETAVVVVEALASGRLAPADAATWLSPRLSPDPYLRRITRAPVRRPRSSLRALPAPVGRAAVGVLCAGLVGGAAILTAACSHAPSMTPAPTHAVHQVKQDAPPSPTPR
jgi:prophage maintenance system killer protein